RFMWLVNNAHKYNFNWTEGRSINEGWHWCWMVGIFPTASTPDPWEGRGAPDPVLSTDPGMTLDGSNNDTSPGSGGTAGLNLNLLEFDMPLLYRVTDGNWKGRHYAIADGFIKHIPTSTSVKLYE